MSEKNNGNDDIQKPSIISRFIDYFFMDGYKQFIFVIIFLLIFTYPLPYYVFTSGGITDLSNRFVIEDSFEQKGSYNLSYVNQMKGSIATCLFSLIMPNWELSDIQNYQYNSTETLEEMNIRDKLSLKSANQTATILAYQKASREVKISDGKLYIYGSSGVLESTNKINIGDIVLSVNGNDIDYNLYGVDLIKPIKDTIESKELGDTITLKLLRNDEEIETDVKIQDFNGEKKVGLVFIKIFDYEVSPKIEFTFKSSESGSSAGLMTTLAIYDSLIPEDLTNGLKIAGTGTIESDGSVGEIGGIEYKITGAESGNADIFFAPSGSNYEDAIKLKKEKNYDIEIVEVKTLDDAINYLKNIKSSKE